MAPTRSEMADVVFAGGYFQKAHPGILVEHIKQWLLNDIPMEELETAYNEQLFVNKQAPRIEVIARAEVNALQLKQAAEQTQRDQFAKLCNRFGITNNEANFTLLRNTVQLDHPAGFEHVVKLLGSGRIAVNSGMVGSATAEQLEHADKLQLADQIVDILRGQLVIKVLGIQSYPGETFGQPDVARRETVEQNRARNLQRLAQLPIEKLRDMAGVATHNLAVKQQNGYVPPAPVESKSPQLTQFEHELQATYIRDVIVGGMPPLPKTWNGATLDANFIRKASKEVLKSIMRMYDMAQLNARLHGIKQIGEYIFESEQ